jgi:hypothetical protein
MFAVQFEQHMPMFVCLGPFVKGNESCALTYFLDPSRANNSTVYVSMPVLEQSSCTVPIRRTIEIGRNKVIPILRLQVFLHFLSDRHHCISLDR